jgi:uncharacterized membrane protein
MLESEVQVAKECKSIGLDPLMAKSMSSLIKDIPKRLVALVNKFLGAEMVLRIAGFSVATWLIYQGKISDYVWALVVFILIFGKEALDTIKDIKGGR